MGIVTRLASDETRRPRNTLSLKTWRGQKSSQLAGGELHLDTREGIETQLTAALYAERNRWDIARRQLPDDVDAWLRGGGFVAGKRLNKNDAERVWIAFLAAMRGVHQ